MRRIAVFLHRYVGLLLAGFLILSGLTGSVIAFADELDRWLNPGVRTVKPAANPQPPEAWVRSVEAAYPNAAVGYVMVPQSPDAAAQLFIGPRPGALPETAPKVNQVFVDPYSAAVLGARDRGGFHLDRLHLVPFLYVFHYTLNLGRWGVWLFGGLGIFWFFDSFVGLYLAWPKRTWEAIRRALTVKWRSRATRVNYDLHRAGGIWTWVVLIVLAFTGVSMNLHAEVFEPLLNAVAPQTPSPGEHAPDRPDPAAPLATSFAQAIAIGDRSLAQRNLTARLGGVSVDHAKGFYYVGYHSAGDIMAEHPGLWITIAAADGSVALFRPSNGATAGDAIHDWQFPLHSGKAFGLTGRILISATGLLVAMLSVTGVVIWWKKRKGRGGPRRGAHDLEEAMA